MYTIDPALERDLREHLLALNYHAFLQAIMLLLPQLGYEQVTLAGRTGYVGRNADGGYDLLATLPVPGGARRVIVQVKQYEPERHIYRRTIDELRGVCLRAGAAEALLITTSVFSESVPVRRYASAAQVPVRLIDGAELTRLMAVHQLGVRQVRGRAGDGMPKRRINPHFFAELEEQFSGIARASADDRLPLTMVLRLTPRRRRTANTSAPIWTTKKAALPRRS